MESFQKLPDLSSPPSMIHVLCMAQKTIFRAFPMAFYECVPKIRIAKMEWWVVIYYDSFFPHPVKWFELILQNTSTLNFISFNFWRTMTSLTGNSHLITTKPVNTKNSRPTHTNKKLSLEKNILHNSKPVNMLAQVYLHLYSKQPSK